MSDPTLPVVGREPSTDSGTVDLPDVATFWALWRAGDGVVGTVPGDRPSQPGGDGGGGHHRIDSLAAFCADAAGVDGCGVSVRDSNGNTVAMHTTDAVATSIEDFQLV